MDVVRVAITGGAGFVGRWLAGELAAAGMTPVVLDQQRPGFDVEHHPCDVMSIHDLRRSFRGCGAVVHLAAISNTGQALQNPQRCVEVNVMGTANVLEAANGNGVEHVVVASSSLVSGQQVPHLMNWPKEFIQDGTIGAVGESSVQYEMLLDPTLEWEVVDELSPFQIDRSVHPYVASKIAAETIALATGRVVGMSVTVCRLGIMYGEYMTPGVLFDTYVKNAMNNKPLVIQGDGQQWRQYLHVSDTARALAMIVTHPGDTAGEIFNLTPQCKTTVADVAEAICKIWGPVKVKYDPPRPNDIAVRFCLAGKAKRTLGWYPQISLEEGVTRLFEWVENQ